MTYKPLVERIPRMWDWILVMLALLGMIWWIAPQQLPVAMYKLLLLSIATVLAPWIDARLFRRKSDIIDGNGDTRHDPMRTMARALVFVGVVLGLTLGV